VYDGVGGEPRLADVWIRGDKVEAGDFSQASPSRIVDAKGLAVAPGLINMLSWSTDSPIGDGRSQARFARGWRPGCDWENLCLLTGSPERILLVGFGPESTSP